MFWLNFLHFYQPPTAADDQIHEVVKSSYQSWADFLIKHKNIKVTANFSGCLIERLFNMGYLKLLKQFSGLVRRGQLELVESAAFHPLLPLLPEKEIIKQIRINHDINRSRLGAVYSPQGFFLPEMAYSPAVGEIIGRFNYHYLLLDQIALTGSIKDPIDNGNHYKIKNSELMVVFRDRKLSQSFVPKAIDLRSIKNKNANEVIITATDGELYGHHYWNWWLPYARVIKNRKITTATLSEYFKSPRAIKEIVPCPSSWESSEKELKKGVPFALWYNPKNKIHQLLWQLANFALELNYANINDQDHFSARLHLEKGLASCTFWWASGRDFELFGAPAWHPEEIEKGALELLRSVRSLKSVDAVIKIKAEKMFLAVHQAVWFKHWREKLAGK